MQLASHNTFTYLPVKKWWQKPFKFAVQCQGKTLEEQYDAGARMFDVRVRFQNGKTPEFAHGSVSFEGNVYEHLDRMNELGSRVYCRVINERDENYQVFKEFCEIIQRRYSNITFFEARNKKGWKLLYEFGEPFPEFIDKYSSWNLDTKLGTGWHLDDLFPRMYAIFLNKHWRKKFKDSEKFLMQDFIGVY